MEIGSIFSIVLLTSISNYSILAYFSIVLSPHGFSVHSSPYDTLYRQKIWLLKCMNKLENSTLPCDIYFLPNSLSSKTEEQ